MTSKTCYTNACLNINHYTTMAILVSQDTVEYQFLGTTFTLIPTSGKNYSLKSHTLFGPEDWPTRSPHLSCLDYFLWVHMNDGMFCWQQSETRDKLLHGIMGSADHIQGNYKKGSKFFISFTPVHKYRYFT